LKGKKNMLYYRVAFRVNDEDIQPAHVEQENIQHVSTTSTDHYMATIQCQDVENVEVAENTENKDGQEIWKWRSTMLTSPHALFTLLRAYSYIPKDQIRVFFASSEDEMDEMLDRQCDCQVTSSITADQFLAGQRLDALDVRRLEIELSAVSDCDVPYEFTLPMAMSERVAWIALMNKYDAGELQS